ncbi:hypothetical protein RF11_05621 [Thelohanellus kitauei]|uniref:Uncharacterized protein n=1 Tax=Thelohanellus kitauei TaxID=669202 RepID=A0A0C2MZD9_THEKT|nr:hypothetical protein RF11_05621 [Thelohanellus kitauei]
MKEVESSIFYRLGDQEVSRYWLVTAFDLALDWFVDQKCKGFDELYELCIRDTKLYLQDPDERVRSQCLKLYVKKRGLDQGSIVQKVFELVDDPSPLVRLSAICVIAEHVTKNGSIGSSQFILDSTILKEKVFRELCSVALCDPDVSVRIETLKKLGEFKNMAPVFLIMTIRRNLYMTSKFKKSYYESQREKFSGEQIWVTETIPVPSEITYIRRSPYGVYIDCLEAEHAEVKFE